MYFWMIRRLGKSHMQKEKEKEMGTGGKVWRIVLVSLLKVRPLISESPDDGHQGQRSPLQVSAIRFGSFARF